MKNPPGNLSPETLEAFKETERPLKIVVEGEEDLAAIPAVLNAPLGSVVVYGQPHEGIVMVRVDEDAKQKFLEILKRFERK